MMSDNESMNALRAEIADMRRGETLAQKALEALRCRREELERELRARAMPSFESLDEATQAAVLEYTAWQRDREPGSWVASYTREKLLTDTVAVREDLGTLLAHIDYRAKQAAAKRVAALKRHLAAVKGAETRKARKAEREQQWWEASKASAAAGGGGE
jgi:hypothetical protein